MSKYILSLKTEQDIEEIYEYTCFKFSRDQGITYLKGLKSTFELLARNPGVGKKRDEIKVGLYSMPYASHVIFYRTFQTHIRIVRVLSGRRDIVRFFIKRK